MTMPSVNASAPVAKAFFSFVVGGLFVFYACSVDGPPPPLDEDEPGAGTPSLPPSSLRSVDSTIAPAVAGEGGWNYQQSAEVDLTGDGRPERVVLTAQVELYRGRPAWDDGQPWQVYVESQDGARTYVYAQRLQLGTLTMRISGGEENSPTVVLLEQLPDRMRVLEAFYRGPGLVSVALGYQRDLDPRGEIASPLLP
jgi:hypothetical protein